MFNLVTSKLNQGKNQLLSRSQKEEVRETNRGTMLLKSREEMDQPIDEQLDDQEEFDQMMRESETIGEEPQVEDNQSMEPTSPR